MWEHRKTLHHLEIYPVLAGVALAVAAVVPSEGSVAVAFFLVATALHCLTEVLGGGLGLRPWLEDDERGVYSHVGECWLPPRRVIPYDGSRRDLALCALLTLPGLYAFDDGIRAVLLVGLGASVAYTALRREFVELAPEWMA